MAQFNSRRRDKPRNPVTRAERSTPTPQTVARAKPNPFPDLIAAGLLPANADSLASDLAEAYRLLTPGCGYPSPEIYGSSVDALKSEALQVAWKSWAATIFQRTFIQPHVYVEWAIGVDRVLDRHAAPSMKRALTYWSRDLAAAWKQVHPDGQGSAAA